MKEISVIVPVYNGESMLDACVTSIQKAGSRVKEIILVDDGSTDRTFQRAKALSESDARIRVIHTDNHGSCEARGAGSKMEQALYFGKPDNRRDKKMDRKQVAAVVVTYNRLPLLQKCIESLHRQTASCDILVVNNHSTDGTGKWLEAQQKAGQLMAQDTGANIGGAGGFNYGMRWAVEAGYEYLWVMDDDCLPEPIALEKLLEADKVLDGDYGWLSSVALWTDGAECKMNRQKLKKSFLKPDRYSNADLIPANQATFVSLLLRAEKVKQYGLPIKEFFIWGDDVEYTRRIAIRGKCPSYVVKHSRVIHAMKDNTGSSIATDRAERIERYRYAFRNEAFTYRQEGIAGACYYLAKCGLNGCRIIVKAPDLKGKRLAVLLKSMVEGANFKPVVENCE